MSNITPYTKNNNYIELRKGERINALSIEDVSSQVKTIIVMTYYTLGQDKGLHESDLMAQAQIFSNDLKNKFGTLTLEEVRELMGRGVRKEFGDYFGLNIVTFNDWAKAFSALPERADAIRNAHIKSLPPPSQPSKEDLKKIADESIAVMISHYKKTGEIMNLGNSNFRALWSDGRIRFDTVKQKEYLDKAETIVGIRLQTKLMAAKQEGRKSDVTPIEKEIEELFHGEHSDIKLEAGRLAIEDWLKTQITE